MSRDREEQVRETIHIEGDIRVEDLVEEAEARARELYPDSLESRAEFLRGVASAWGTSIRSKESEAERRKIYLEGYEFGRPNRKYIPLPPEVLEEVKDSLDQYFGQGRYAGEGRTGNRGNLIFVWQMVRRYGRTFEELMEMVDYERAPRGNQV